jgi:hypothetical protein
MLLVHPHNSFLLYLSISIAIVSLKHGVTACDDTVVVGSFDVDFISASILLFINNKDIFYANETPITSSLVTNKLLNPPLPSGA